MIHDLIMSGKLSPQGCSGSASSTPGLPCTLRRCCRRPNGRPGCNRSSKDRFQALTARRRRLRSSPRQLAPNLAHLRRLQRLQLRPAPAVPQASPICPTCPWTARVTSRWASNRTNYRSRPDLEQRLRQAIRNGQAKSPDERIALGLEKPLEEPAAVQSNRAIDVIDQQIRRYPSRCRQTRTRCSNVV